MKTYPKKVFVLFSLATMAFLVSCGEDKKVADENKKSTKTVKNLNLDPSIESKIDSVVGNMTLEEKVGQTCQITLDVMMKRDKDGKILEPNVLDSARVKKAIVDYKVGSVLNVGYHTFDRNKWYEIISHLQNTATSETNSKIPLIYGIDAIHGVTYTVGGTLFPQEIGLAGTWNKECARDLGKVTAYETRASGISWNFSPVLDLGRQPLWSRFFETLGEDVYLCKTLGKEIVKGYQGEKTSSNENVVACLKHFVGYSNPLSGRDRTPAWIPERYMEQYYLPPFKESIDAGALTVMVNSGEVNGIPGHSNYHLLTEVLKERWGFIGFAVSDWEDMIMLNTVAEIEPTYKKAIANAINAGVDMSMVPYSPFYEKYCENLIELVKEGAVSEERLNDAVRRILRVKFMSGLFENPFYAKELYANFGSKEFQEKAYKAASESITLLKNEGNTLPIQSTSKLLVMGPTANSLNCLNGAWTHTWQGVDDKYNTKGKNTILGAFQEKLGPENVKYEEGVSMKIENSWEVNTLITSQSKVKSLAQGVDAIIVCVGEMPGTERPGDIKSLNLPQEQIDLINFAVNTGKKVVVVLVEGHPKIINPIVEKVDGILQAYLPGNEGGEAIADVVLGNVNPSGKLPYSYPRYDGVIEHYDHKTSENKSGKSSKNDAYNPQWDFGYGLSYTSFEYSDLKLNKATLSNGGAIEVSVKVKNTGVMDGKEVVQLYVKDKFASVSPVGKKLIDFDKVLIKANEEKEVTFQISEEDLLFVDRNNQWVSEEGEFYVFVGSDTTQFQLNK